MIRKAVLAFMLSTGVALASPAADVAQQAADELHGAIEALGAAQSKADRVAALTQTISAYERGLGALRDGLRRASVREAEIRAKFEAKREDIGKLLGVMSTLSQSEGPLLLLHPGGPLGTARSGMMLGAVTPALQAEAEQMRTDLQEIESLRRVQTNAEKVLQAGLGSVQAARTALSKAVADRTNLPRRYLEEPEELRELIESVDTLEGFSTGLADLEGDIGAPMADFPEAKGDLPMPVLGKVLRAYDEADAAGIRRPGLVVATAPAALVTTPWPATIRYRGPLLDYGNVMILEPAEGYLLVLAGLGSVYGETGDVLAAGAPVGLMGGREPGAQEFGEDFVKSAQMGSGAGRTETLYIELRKGKKTLDPAPWFAPTKDQNKG